MKRLLASFIALAAFFAIEFLCLYLIFEAARSSLKMIEESPLSMKAVSAVVMFAFVFTVMCVVSVAAIVVFCLAIEIWTRESLGRN